jgi:hypothetical protein
MTENLPIPVWTIFKGDTDGRVKRLNIRGPDTGAIEVVPASQLHALRGVLEEAIQEHRKLAEGDRVLGDYAVKCEEPRAVAYYNGGSEAHDHAANRLQAILDRSSLDGSEAEQAAGENSQVSEATKPAPSSSNTAGEG